MLGVISFCVVVVCRRRLLLLLLLVRPWSDETVFFFRALFVAVCLFVARADTDRHSEKDRQTDWNSFPQTRAQIILVDRQADR